MKSPPNAKNNTPSTTPTETPMTVALCDEVLGLDDGDKLLEVDIGDGESVNCVVFAVLVATVVIAVLAPEDTAFSGIKISPQGEESKTSVLLLQQLSPDSASEQHQLSAPVDDWMPGQLTRFAKMLCSALKSLYQYALRILACYRISSYY